MEDRRHSRFFTATFALLLICLLIGSFFGRLRATHAAASYCQVTYTLTNQWSGGFGANIAIENTSSSAWTGWSLTFTFPVSGQDGNAWCRDDLNHLDLVQSSLDQFLLNGQPVGNMYPNAWNNRQMSWQFIPAPNYTGDIQIGFLQGASPYWSAISITHLANGIHGVEYNQNGTWVNAPMDSDMGNDYVVLPTTPGGTNYQLRVFDASNQAINNGRIYNFSYPGSCGSSCPSPHLALTYTTSQMVEKRLKELRLQIWSGQAWREGIVSPGRERE